MRATSVGVEYDPQANTWRMLGNLPEKLLAPSVAIVSGRLVVSGAA